MVDISKQIIFWRDNAKEDWDVARQLVDNGRTRHGLFFAHLALEKSLKEEAFNYMARAEGIFQWLMSQS